MTKASFRQNFRVHTCDRRVEPRHAVLHRAQHSSSRVETLSDVVRTKYGFAITYFHFSFVGRMPVCFEDALITIKSYIRMYTLVIKRFLGRSLLRMKLYVTGDSGFIIF